MISDDSDFSSDGEGNSPLPKTNKKIGPHSKQNNALYQKFRDSVVGKYTLTEQDISELEEVEEICPDVLRAEGDDELQTVTKVDFSWAKNVVKIGDCLCLRMYALESFDFKCFPKLVYISFSLFYECKSIHEVDFSPVAKTLRTFDVWNLFYGANRDGVKYKGLHKLADNLAILQRVKDNQGDPEFFRRKIKEAKEIHKFAVDSILLLSYKANNGKLGQMLNTHYAPRALIAKFFLS